MTDPRPLYSHAIHRTTSLRRQAGKRHEKRPHWMGRRRYARYVAAAADAACGRCQGPLWGRSV